MQKVKNMQIEDRDDVVVELGPVSTSTLGVGQMGLEPDGFVRPAQGLSDE